MTDFAQFSPAKIDWNFIVTRAKKILLTPDVAWLEIKEEPSSIESIYTKYLGVLALLGALCGVIGMTIVGIPTPMGLFRMPFFSTLILRLVMLALSLGSFYVGAVVMQKVAPKFNGSVDLTSAFKILAYGATAGLVGQLFSIIPLVGMIGSLLGLYSIYLVYRGIAHLTTVPEEKRLTFFLALVGIMIAIGIAIAIVMAILGATTGLAI